MLLPLRSPQAGVKWMLMGHWKIMNTGAASRTRYKTQRGEIKVSEQVLELLHLLLSQLKQILQPVPEWRTSQKMFSALQIYLYSTVAQLRSWKPHWVFLTMMQVSISILIPGREIKKRRSSKGWVGSSPPSWLHFTVEPVAALTWGVCPRAAPWTERWPAGPWVFKHLLTLGCRGIFGNWLSPCRFQLEV